MKHKTLLIMGAAAFLIIIATSAHAVAAKKNPAPVPITTNTASSGKHPHPGTIGTKPHHRAGVASVSGTITAISDTSITILPPTPHVRTAFVSPLQARHSKASMTRSLVSNVSTTPQPVTIPITEGTLILDKAKLVVGAKATVQETTPSNGTMFAAQIHADNIVTVHPRVNVLAPSH